MSEETKMIMQAIRELSVQVTTGFAEIRKEMDEFKTEIRAEVAELRMEVAEVKKDLAEFKVEVRAQFKEVHARLDAQTFQMGRLQEEVLVLKNA